MRKRPDGKGSSQRHTEIGNQKKKERQTQQGDGAINRQRLQTPFLSPENQPLKPNGSRGGKGYWEDLLSAPLPSDAA